MKNISPEKAAKELEKEANNVEENDLDKVLSKKEKIENKILSNDTVEKYVDKAKMMFSLINDYRKGTYKEVPWKSIAAIAGALLYVLNPLDLIPDFIPVLGMVDDASVLAICLKMVNDDLEKYMNRKETSPSTQSGQTA